MKEDLRTVTMPADDWVRLTTYLLITTKYREREKAAWEKLSEEKAADGTPKFPNAPSNAEFWDETISSIERVIKTIG